MRFRTEFGVIEIEPGEICVIPRGVIFRVELIDGPARAYVCENYGGGFTLPDRGPIGANCLANPRDFLTPVAAYEDIEAPCTLFVKWGGELYRTEVAHSPLDVVAWHGNYYPYKYDLRRFSPVGAILFDHPDPSIFTVMTSPSETPGTANIDFVIFPERWGVAENTFRPPWYHRNIMSEFMGLVYGVYDAKPEGFVPGGISLHNTMLPHGPDEQAFEHASNVELKPVKLTNTLAFMFETRFRQRVTKFAAEHAALAARLHRLLERAEEALRSEPAGAGLRHATPAPSVIARSASDEAIQNGAAVLDCFASLAMTALPCQRRDHARLRMRAMKASNESSPTCHQGNCSARKAHVRVERLLEARVGGGDLIVELMRRLVGGFHDRPRERLAARRRRRPAAAAPARSRRRTCRASSCCRLRPRPATMRW